MGLIFSIIWACIITDKQLMFFLERGDSFKYSYRSKYSRGMNIYVICAPVVALAVTYLQFYGIFGSSAIPAIRIFFAGIGGIICGFVLVLRNSKYRKANVPKKPKNVQEMSDFMDKVTRMHFHVPYQHSTIVSNTVDKEIQEVFDLFIRDFCLSWFQNLGKDEHAFKEILSKELWDITHSCVSKLQHIDMVKFLSNDLVNLLCNHFQELRLSDQRRFPGTAKPFVLHPCLSSNNAELEYLRTASEAMLYALLSKENSDSAPLRILLREILAYTVFQPLFERICDPDYINQTLLWYLESKEKLTESHKKDYAYAETYEEFIRLINTSQDIEHVKSLRYHIIAEIMQATSIHNLKGLHVDNSGHGQSHDKAEMLRARNLKRYINQCTVAKAQCEKRIKMLGGPDYTSQNSGDVKLDEGNVSSRRKKQARQQKILTYAEIIDNSLARSYFMQFLGHNGAGHMLRFWMAVENMKQLKKVKPDKVQDSAKEIFNLFIVPSTPHAVRIDSTIVRKMESYLNGERDDSAFFDAQMQIYRKMEEKYYRKFIISEEYVQYICQLESALDHFRTQGEQDVMLLNWSDGSEGFEQKKQPASDGKTSNSIEEKNEYIIKQLSILDQKLASKTQQVELVKKLHDMHIQGKVLEKEIEVLKKEKCDLEARMERAELWCDNIGKWRVVIQSASIEETNDKPLPVYVLMVDRASSLTDSLPSSETNGWIVARTIRDFQNLHSKLKECSSRLKKELPLPSKKWFKNFDEEFLNKSKAMLEEYVKMLLEDQTLCLNEELYQFFCPNFENTKQLVPPVEKKPVFSLKSVLKSLPLIDFNFTDDLDEEQSEEDGPGDRKDSIAEPLYNLTGEIFELKGVFKWLRRTLIAFVQVTFGRTINREIRELVEWVVSEPMIVYYIQLFCDVMWPQGKLAPAAPVRTDAEKIKTRRKVKEKLLEMSPEVLQNLVGKRNCKLGIIKMFEAFQDIRTNKHLAYLIFELCIFTVFPEIRAEASQNTDSTNTVKNSDDDDS